LDEAPVTIIEMLDLNCRPCMDVVRAVDKIRDQFGDEVRIVHKHLPSDIYTPTNTAAFYAKLAQREGLFWEYRHLVRNLTEIGEDTYNDQLLKLGIALPSLQQAIRAHGRQFYRELDADALQAKQFGETVPPALYVNGIKVGGGAVPLSALEELVKYELATARAKADPRRRGGTR
jgi:protein-disulfide isomerase